MKARPRTSPTPLFNLTRSRSGKPFTKKDVKKADRSEEVYENKGHHDIKPEKKSDFMSDSSKSAGNFVAFVASGPRLCQHASA
jgi:hypothetical protein